MSSRISNGDIDDEDFADISDWADEDSGTGVSSQVTFDGKSCMKLDSGTSHTGQNNALRSQDIGSFGARTVFSINVYCDTIGKQSDTDNFRFGAYNGTYGCAVILASDGLFAYNGTYNEVGTNLVQQDTWQEGTFDVNWTGQTADIYLNQVLVGSDINCFYATTVSNGTISLRQNGYSASNQITYIDWFKAGSNFLFKTNPIRLLWLAILASVKKVIAWTELDYMEYANDAAAQAAYVSSGVYGSNFLTGGTATADTTLTTYVASRVVDGNTGTSWISTDSAFPHWWKYDLGAGVTKTARKLRLIVAADPDYVRFKDFTLQGSNNDSDWTTVYTGQFPDATTGWYDFEFANSTAYRYYKINITSSWEVDANYAQIYEAEMMEAGLQCYSEATIKSQGDYSLKGIAAATGSLNDTLTRTVDPVIDLTGKTQIKFDIRSSRTGENIKIGIHDSGGTTTEKTHTISDANTFETDTWDISAVSDANKDAIDSIIVTIVNADDANTFYIDNVRYS